MQGLRNSSSKEVAILTNTVARDVRSTTGRNLNLIASLTSCDPFVVGSNEIRSKLVEAERIEVEEVNKWRIGYLNILLKQWQELRYAGLEEEEETVKELISSLCIN